MLNNPIVKIDGAKFLTTESGDIVPLVGTDEELVLTGTAEDLAEGKTLMGADGVVTGTAKTSGKYKYKCQAYTGFIQITTGTTSYGATGISSDIPFADGDILISKEGLLGIVYSSDNTLKINVGNVLSKFFQSRDVYFDVYELIE